MAGAGGASSSVAKAVTIAVSQSEAELAKCLAQVRELTFERDCRAAEAIAAKGLLKKAHEELASVTTKAAAASSSLSTAPVFYGSNKSARAAAAAAEKAATEKAAAASASAKTSMAMSTRDSLAEVRCEVATQEVKTLQGLLKSSRDVMIPLKAERVALIAEVQEWKRKCEQREEHSQQAFHAAQSSGRRDMGAITKIVELEGLVEHLKAQLAQSQAQLAYSAANLSAASSSSASDTIGALKQQVALLREECARKGRLLAAAKQRAEGAEATSAQATSSLEASEEKQKRMSSELARRRTTIEDLTKRLGEAEAAASKANLQGGSSANSTHGSSELQGSKMREDAAAALSRDARQRQQVNVLNI
jgi:hypothetical protein